MTVLAAALVLGLSAPSISYDWQSVAIGCGGFVTGITPHPFKKGLVYARTDIGGAFRWDDRDSRWTPLLDWLQLPEWNWYGVESLAVDPYDPNFVVAALGTYTNEWAGNGAIATSTNQGRTWEVAKLPFKNGGNMPGRSMGERLAVNPSDSDEICFGTRTDGLWISLNRGKSWSRVESSLNWPSLKGHGIAWVAYPRAVPDHHSEIYVATTSEHDAIRVSHDLGKTWEILPGQPKGMLPHQAKFTRFNNLIVTYSDKPGPNEITSGAVYQYSRVDHKWTNITPEQPKEGNRFGYAGVAVDVRDENRILVSTIDRWAKGDTVFTTTDGGKNWTSLQERSTMDPGWFAYLNWHEPKPKFGHWIGDVELDPFDGNHAWFVTGATIWQTKDLNKAKLGWYTQLDGFEMTAITDLIAPRTYTPLLSAMGDLGGFRHDDLGRSPKGGFFSNPIQYTVTSLEACPQKPDFLVRVGFNYKPETNIAFSTDEGRTWAPAPTSPAPGLSGGTVAVSADGKRIVWSSGQGSMWWTEDQGQSWTPSTGIDERGFVAADQFEPNLFWFKRESDGALYRSVDGGKSFVELLKGWGESDRTIQTSPLERGVVYIPTSKGVMANRDGSDQFVAIGDLTEVNAVGLGKADAGTTRPTIFAAGHLGKWPGIYRCTDGKTWTRISNASHGFATVRVLEGDLRQFGRVFIGTNGRGIFMGNPAGKL
ncbi:MAG: carbohydrate-binding protein [Armatimonadetes bacterium]|nr:carbohydrate-binding protein [Armatimonadota bacterium]